MPIVELSEAERVRVLNEALKRGDTKPVQRKQTDRESLEETMRLSPGSKLHQARHAQTVPADLRKEKLRSAILNALDDHHAPLLSREHDELVTALRAMMRDSLGDFNGHERAILNRWPQFEGK
jgi:hypothetical protein